LRRSAGRRPRDRTIDEPAAVADALGRDQDALGVHPIEDVAEALALDTDQILGRHPHILEGQCGRAVVEHGADRSHGQAIPDGLMQVDDEDAEPVAALTHVR